MPSGERIQFGPNVNFLFETHDLSCASPATISRMGMIFLRFLFRYLFFIKIIIL
jgi:dynein heavy chain 2